MINEKMFQQVCLDHYEKLIQKRPYSIVFENWEKVNLNALMRTTPGYKRAAKSKSKAQTLNRFENEEQKNKLIQDFLKAHGEPVRLKDVTDDELVSIFIDGYTSKHSNISADIGLFIHIKVLLPAITKKIVSRIESDDVTNKVVVETQIPPDLDEYIHKSDEINANTIANSIQQSFISNLPIDNEKIANVTAYFCSLILEYPQAVQSIIGLNELVTEHKPKVLELKSTMSKFVPKEQSEFRVIVSNMTDMSGFYIADVIAVETLSGDLISLSEEMAVDLFPDRGSIFIPISALSTIPSKDLAFGCCVEVSDRDGINKFRFKELWEGVYSLLPCEYGFDNVKQLIDELKSFDLKTIPNDFWFLLPDGSLIKPKTKRIMLLSTSFNEAWWFLKSESTNVFITERSFISKPELKNKSTISMQSNESILAAIRDLGPESSVSTEVSNRLPYLERHITETPINAEKIIETLFALFAQTPILQNMLSAQKNKYLTEIDGEIKSARGEKEQIEAQIKTFDEKKIKLQSNISDIEKSISGRIESALKKSKTDLVKIFDEPLAQLFLNAITNEGATKNTSEFNLVNSLPMVNSIPIEKLKLTFKQNGVRLAPEHFLENIFPALEAMLKQKQLLAFSGQLSDLFISAFVNYMRHSTYAFSKLLLADEVSLTSKTILSSRTYPVVINSTEKVGLGIFQHELSICTELQAFTEYPILICARTIEDQMQEIIYFDCDRLVDLTDKGLDYEEYTEEIGNPESSRKTKLCIKSTNDYVREWYFRSRND